ncbi:hypothetical protein SBRY_30248 [Actinacidiphila bryophytorum]|uniref:Uncharacterized protein n=1 Tax=Actinacidiphila bryophytorum TaxID=1436133 RepID=A0A9W4H0N8_9ACTN|nr:hypothetical protein SBRY_30248 [Actinacidiphila bryophytorum]
MPVGRDGAPRTRVRPQRDPLREPLCRAGRRAPDGNVRTHRPARHVFPARHGARHGRPRAPACGPGKLVTTIRQRGDDR